MLEAKWSETKIGRILARNTFKDYLCVLPNCTWTGYEIDLLVVTPDRRIIDVEIKISRADLRADKAKDKWWRQMPGEWDAGLRQYKRPPPIAKEWPKDTWKHYYAMPAEIWDEKLRAEVQPVSGVLLLQPWDRWHLNGQVECVKRAKPCRTATVLDESQVISIARLASLRMWDAYLAAEKDDQ